MLEAAQSILPEWTSRSPSDMGVVLIESFAYAADILSFYTDRVANESFLQTAVQRSSVLNIAEMLGYRPAAATAAKVTLRFTTQPNVGDVLIPECTRVSTQGSSIVFFELDEDLIIPSNSVTTGTVAATEGQKFERETLGVSSGVAGQQLITTHSPVIAGSMTIFVDEGGGFQKWREVETLLESDGTDAVFVLSEDEFDRTAATFGDGVTGKIPGTGAIIQASYRIGGGTRGNVSAGTLTTIVNSLPGVTAVTNPAAAVGGTDIETLASIRQNAPRVHRTASRAVSLQDHADLALSRAKIAKANAVKASNYTTSNRHVEVYVAPAEPTALPTSDLMDVETFLISRAVTGSDVDVLNVSYIPINITAEIHVADGFLADSVRSVVNDAISQFLEYGRQEIGGLISQAHVYRAVLDIDGVDYVIITQLDASDSRNVGGATTVDIYKDEVPVPGTFTLTTVGGLT